MKRLLLILAMLIAANAMAQPLYRFDGQYYPWTSASPAFGEQFSGKSVVELDGRIYTVGLHRTSLSTGVGEVFVGVHDVVSGNLGALYGLGLRANDVKIIKTQDDGLLIVAYTELVIPVPASDEITVFKIDQSMNVQWSKYFSYPSPVPILNPAYKNDYHFKAVVTSNHDPANEEFYIATGIASQVPTTPNDIDLAVFALDAGGAPLWNYYYPGDVYDGLWVWMIPSDIFFAEPNSPLEKKIVIAGTKHHERSNILPTDAGSRAFTIMLNSDGTSTLGNSCTEYRAQATVTPYPGLGFRPNRVINPQIIGTDYGYTLAFTEKNTGFFTPLLPSGSKNRDGISIINLYDDGGLLKSLGKPLFFCGNTYNHLWSLSLSEKGRSNLVMNYYDSDDSIKGYQALSQVDISGPMPMVLNSVGGIKRVFDETNKHQFDPASGYYLTIHGQPEDYIPLTYPYGLNVVNPNFNHGCDQRIGLVYNTDGKKVYMDGPQGFEAINYGSWVDNVPVLNPKLYGFGVCPLRPAHRNTLKTTPLQSDVAQTDVPAYSASENSILIPNEEYVRLQLIDLSGRLIYSEATERRSILLPALQPGLYIVRFYKKDGSSVSIKLIK